MKRQKYKKKDNNKWYTKLQNKEIQNTALCLTIFILIAFGGYVLKYVLNVAYKYLDIEIEYEMVQGQNNTSLWDVYNYEEYYSNQDQEKLYVQTQENAINIYPENATYSISNGDDNNSHIKMHNFLFSEYFLTSINILSSINYHVLAGVFFWGR